MWGSRDSGQLQGSPDEASPPPCPRYPDGVNSATRRKTSFELDFAKLDAVREALGTKTLTDTVDAALDEVIKLHAGRRLADLLTTPGLLDLDDPAVMASAWRE